MPELRSAFDRQGVSSAPDRLRQWPPRPFHYRGTAKRELYMPWNMSALPELQYRELYNDSVRVCASLSLLQGFVADLQGIFILS